MNWKFFLFVLPLAFFFSCSVSLPHDVAAAYKTVPEKIDFNQHIKPILSDRCFKCHGPDKGKLQAGLRLDIKESAYGELSEDPGHKAIFPGSLRKSELVKRILSDDPEEMMPKPASHLTLSAYEKAVLIKWIEQGAEYKPHWAFIKPEKSAIPEVQQKAWIKNPIDNFVLNRLEKEKLSPSPEAHKQTCCAVSALI